MSREELVKKVEVSKGKNVQITDEELDTSKRSSRDQPNDAAVGSCAWAGPVCTGGEGLSDDRRNREQ